LSPDGKRLAYVASEGGRSQLFVRWMQTDQAARITDLTETPENLQWSPDGRSIAFIMMTADEKTNLGVSPPRPKAPIGPSPSPSSPMSNTGRTRRLFEAGYSHAFVVSAEGGFPRQLTLALSTRRARFRGRLTAGTCS